MDLITYLAKTSAKFVKIELDPHFYCTAKIDLYTTAWEQTK